MERSKNGAFRHHPNRKEKTATEEKRTKKKHGKRKISLSRRQGSLPGKKKASSPGQRLHRAAAALVSAGAITILAAGLIHVDGVIRTTMLPGAPPILRSEEAAPSRYMVEILGQPVELDFTGIAAFLEEARSLLATPPAPVRAGLWLWLRAQK